MLCSLEKLLRYSPLKFRCNMDTEMDSATLLFYWRSVYKTTPTNYIPPSRCAAKMRVKACTTEDGLLLFRGWVKAYLLTKSTTVKICLYPWLYRAWFCISTKPACQVLSNGRLPFLCLWNIFFTNLWAPQANLICKEWFHLLQGDLWLFLCVLVCLLIELPGAY